MHFVKEWFIKPFSADYKLLTVLSVPALLLGAFGLHQLGLFPSAYALPAQAAKFCCEFLFLGILLSVLQLAGLKNKTVAGILAFAYYLTMTADLVLLWFFKERFGAKYLDTLQGGDYNFLTDWRVLSYLVLLAAFSFISVRVWLKNSPRQLALRRLLVSVAGTVLLYSFNPLELLPAPADFYSIYMMPPSVVYTARAVLTRQPAPQLTSGVPDAIAPLAAQYNVFSARNTGVGKKYTRVILIASESLSNKYLHHFNPQIPAEASRPLDKLFEHYPSASLRHVSLSTLYGLSVIFTSHPFVKLAYENGYPFSFVRMLQARGFHTAFLRGANETYMDENILFKQAGFNEVIGATYFQTRPDYAKYIDWWGLLDRKLFDYAVEYLSAHRHEPTFITLLTVDSHVPLGRLDYLGETYNEIAHPAYEVPTLPRAFARFGQDVERFLAALQANRLLDDNTLILIMPDHPSYSNTPTNDLFSPFKPEFDNLPFIIITQHKITAPITNNPLASQLDIAPTVLDLLNITPPQGMFGHSLFDDSATRTVFDIKEDYAVITTANDKRVVALNSTRPQDKKLIDLMTTFIKN